MFLFLGRQKTANLPCSRFAEVDCHILRQARYVMSHAMGSKYVGTYRAGICSAGAKLVGTYVPRNLYQEPTLFRNADDD
eukprot:6202609-Pleurochrysis_carterae.AAC.5